MTKYLITALAAGLAICFCAVRPSLAHENVIIDCNGDLKAQASAMCGCCHHDCNKCHKCDSCHKRNKCESCHKCNTCKPKCHSCCKPKCEKCCKPKCESCHKCNTCKPKCHSCCRSKCNSCCHKKCCPAPICEFPDACRGATGEWSRSGLSREAA
jgi:hypothetical protein